jgi:hypothetical protein
MIRLTVTLTALAMLAISHAQLISVAAPTQTAAQIVAEAVIDGCNAGLNDRVSRMKNMWETVWDNPRATPPEIFAALGTKGRVVLLAAVQVRADLTALATLSGTTAEALLGDAKYLSPRYPVTIASDGRVTVTMP